ncbi:MAG TPA: acyl-CoA dehydrogenase family protein [Bacillota bacterium]|nr:acyl-CoA dehydrogenase family protein [Bacillota bacterium]
MNFELTEEQKDIQQKVKEFAEEVIKPRALDIDREGKFPEDIFKQMGELGFMGIPFSKEYGGQGGDTLSYALAVREIGKVCASTGLSYCAALSLGATPIEQFGTEEQKQTYLRPIAEGKSLGAFGLTERDAGSDASATKTSASKKDDAYILNGEKYFVSNANYSQTIIVTAISDFRATGEKVVSSIIVPTDSEGVTISTEYDKMGVRGSDTARVTLENVSVPEENLLGDKEHGFRQFFSAIDGGRIAMAALGLGIAEAALEKSLAYAKERKQFGRTISNFQAIQFKLADMAMEVELAKNMICKAAWLKDSGKKFAKEASFAKLFASEAAFRAAHQASQIHGGYGYMREYEIERLLRDAKVLEISEGTSEIQRVLISKHLGC